MNTASQGADVYVSTADLNESSLPPGHGNPFSWIQRSIKQRGGALPHRNRFLRQDVIQLVFLALVITFFYIVIQNLTRNLEINFDFLDDRYTQGISEGPDYQGELGFLASIPIIGDDFENWSKLQPGSNGRAIYVGLINTLRVVVLGLVAATILGILVGIGLLANNWLTRMTSTVYVEIFRNTPLLVLLFFIYQGVVLGTLPDVSADPVVGDVPIYLNTKGLFYPALRGTETTPYLTIMLLNGIVVGILLWRWRLRVQDQTGVPANTMRYFLMSVLGFAIIGVALAHIQGETPLRLESPKLRESRILSFEDGIGSKMSPEYVALWLGLVLYTAAFIADIVRAGIQAVPHGQIEAARASGLTNGQTLRLVVLPQALRLIIPPLINQYLNLSKNSSLAVAIAFADVYYIATTINNKSGQAVALFALLMLTYLILSLILSLVMNSFNRSMRLKSR